MFFFDFTTGQSAYRKNDAAEKYTDFQTEAAALIIRQINSYKESGFLSRLTDAILEKKLLWITKAKTKAELKEICKPSVPEYYGGKFGSKGIYHVEEEELLLWSMASLQAPLNAEGYRRYGELFCKFFLKEGKEIFKD